MRTLEETYRSMLDGSREAIYVTDLNRNLLYVNEQAKHYGKRLFQSELSCQKCYEALPGRDTPCPFCKMDQLSEDRYLTRRFQGVTGRIFELRGKLIDWCGIPAHIEYISNITETEEAIQQAEKFSNQQRSLYEHLDMGVCLYHYCNQELRPLVCNDQYRKLFALPSGFDEGKPITLELRNFSRDGREQLRMDVLEHLHSNEPFQHICRIRDMETNLIRNILLKMDCEDQGERGVFWYVTALDVSNWVKKENQLNHILSSIRGGIASYEVRKDGRVKRIMYTDGLLSMQGYNRQEYEKAGDDDSLSLVYEKDRERLRQEITASISTGSSISTIYRIYHKDKGYIWVNLSATPAEADAEGSYRYNAVLTNVSYQFELYQKMLDIAETGLLVTDQKTRELYFTNQAAEQILLEARKLCNHADTCNIASDHHCAFCSDSALAPSEDCTPRKQIIGNKTYRTYTHQIQWMGRPAMVQYLSDISEEVDLQEQIALEEERYRMVVEESGIALMDLDILHDCAYMNEEFQNYAISQTDSPVQQFDCRKGFTHVHPEDVLLLKQYYETLQDHGTASVEKLRLQMKDGSYRWSELHGIIIENTDKEPTRKICFIRDIDEITRQNEELQIRYDMEMMRLNSFEENVVERISLDLTENCVVDAASSNTQKLPQLIGRKIEDLLAARLAHTEKEEDREKLKRFMDRELLLQAYYTNEKTFLEMQVPVPGSTEKVHYLSSSKFAKNPKNGHIFVFMETRNIEKEKTEETLMRRLLETNYESALVVHATTGRIKIGFTKGDPDFTTEIKQTYEDLAVEDIHRTVLPENQTQVIEEMSLAAIRRKLEATDQCSGKIERRADGKRAYKMWTAVYFDENKEYVLITVSNITEVYEKDLESARILKTALEDAELASKAKSVFLARMSHEIRTPITTVSGTLELIRQDCIKQRLEKNALLQRIDMASAANQYLLTLINDILDISKIESNELTLAPEPSNVQNLMDSLYAMVHPLAEKKRIRLIWERKTKLSDWYRMDRVRVSQILMNLLSNAIKFTPEEGTVSFSMEASCIDGDGSLAQVNFMVRDTGVGISDDFKTEVFEPFKQEYVGNKQDFGGTGIGLSISKKLAQMMGGDITFESRKDHGTVFTAFIQLEIVAPQEETERAESGAEQHLEGLQILLCEDNKVNQTIARQLLEAKGCIVTTADDGREGVDVFDRSSEGYFDAILMDIRMPNMDGIEATKRIRGLLRRDAKQVPILAMSANAYEEDRQISMAAGMNQHLSKPVEPEMLYRTLEQYCRNVR